MTALSVLHAQEPALIVVPTAESENNFVSWYVLVFFQRKIRLNQIIVRSHVTYQWSFGRDLNYLNFHTAL